MGCKNCSDITLLSGTDGVGIQTIVDNGDGTFTIFMTNGTTFTSANLTGSAATATAGTTTTGIPGSSAAVVNSGTTSAAVFDFTIPRGDSGYTLGARAVSIGSPGDYSLVLANDFPNKFLTVTCTLTTGNLQIPLNASQAIPIGYKITVIQISANPLHHINLNPIVGVTLISDNSYTKFATGSAVVELLKIATDTWAAWGDLTV